MSNNKLPILYPPGRILHIVRSYPRGESKTPTNKSKVNTMSDRPSLKKDTTDSKKQFKGFFRDFSKSSVKSSPKPLPVYKVIETDNKELNEILISPRMLQDHLPDNLIRCMKAVRPHK